MDDDSWFGFSVAICTYPMGSIIDSLTRILNVPFDEFDEPRRRFWNDVHPASLAYLRSEGKDMKFREEFEKELSSFVRRAHDKYPKLVVTSDNPTFDIRLLDIILLKHKVPAVCFRSDGTWTHVVDTVSYQNAVQDFYKATDLRKVHQSIFGLINTN